MGRFYRINPQTMELEELGVEASEALHAVHADEIPPTEHPATGKIFTSRKKFDEETVKSGCVPVGGCDRPTRKTRSINLDQKRDHLSQVLEKAYYDLRDNRIPKPSENPRVREMWERLNK